LIDIKYYNPRDFAMPGKKAKAMTYAERRVDDRPYGGGPGMVMEALPVARAIEKAISKANSRIKYKISKKKARAGKVGGKIKIIFFSPAGAQFTNGEAEKWRKWSDIILVCGRYEGIDSRVRKIFRMADVSVGPFTLTGGELPAMIVIDAVSRRLPGVLGDPNSVEELRVSSSDVYTRPEVIEYNGSKYRVPKILLSGDRARIDAWKKSRRA
jgi:tRNA (guanine37-N1)-methyltransferase